MMELVDILIILSVMAVAFIIGRISKGPICTDKKEEVEVAPQDIYFPQITVVFQQDIDDDEDLCKEIADMYLSNRAFYYSGKGPSQELSVLSEEMDVYVHFYNVEFSKLQKIEV